MNHTNITRRLISFSLAELMMVVALFAIATAIVVTVKRELIRKELTIDGLAFSPDGNRVIAQLDDGSLRGWQVADGQQIISLPALSPFMSHRIAFSPDGKTVARVQNYNLDVVDLLTGKELSRRNLLNCEGYTFSPDGKQLAFVNEFANQLLLVDPFNSTSPATIVGQLDQSASLGQNYLVAMKFGPQYLYLVGAIFNDDAWSYELAKWDIISGKVDRVPITLRAKRFDEAGQERGPFLNFATLVISKDNHYVAVLKEHGETIGRGAEWTGVDASVEVFDAHTLARRGEVGQSSSGFQARGLEILDAGRSLAAFLHPDLEIYDAETLELKKRVKLDEFRTMEASPDGRLLAIAGEKSISFYDGNQLRNFVELRESTFGLVPLTVCVCGIVATLIVMRRRKKMRAGTK